MNPLINYAKRRHLTHERLVYLLRYDEGDQCFYWRGGIKRGVRDGMKAGTYSEKYATIKIDGFVYKVHHLVWLWKTGKWASEFLDHRDLSTKRNVFDNLREATRSQNNANRRCKSNKHGFKGVAKSGNRSRSYISVNGRNTNLGTYDTAFEAHQAYRSAATAQFGEFARFE